MNKNVRYTSYSYSYSFQFEFETRYIRNQKKNFFQFIRTKSNIDKYYLRWKWIQNLWIGKENLDVCVIVLPARYRVHVKIDYFYEKTSMNSFHSIFNAHIHGGHFHFAQCIRLNVQEFG